MKRIKYVPNGKVLIMEETLANEYVVADSKTWQILPDPPDSKWNDPTPSGEAVPPGDPDQPSEPAAEPESAPVEEPEKEEKEEEEDEDEDEDEESENEKSEKLVESHHALPKAVKRVHVTRPVHPAPKTKPKQQHKHEPAKKNHNKKKK